MAETEFPLPVVDGCTLDERRRRLLRPGAVMRDRAGRAHRLPRWFYEVHSWRQARELQLSPHVGLWELMDVDVREAELLRVAWPRYVPCAVSVLAAHLEVLRREVDTYVHVAANGGYRSPAHRLSTHASPHCWGTAANLYRVGDDWLHDRETIERYAGLVRRLLPHVRVSPYGPSPGEADDHLHLDLGWLRVEPPEADGAAGGEDGTEPSPDGDAEETDAGEGEG